jgi:hypothetical protein
MIGATQKRQQHSVQEHARAASIVMSVMKRCEEKLVVPVAQAINHFISVAQDGDSPEAGSFWKMEVSSSSKYALRPHLRPLVDVCSLFTRLFSK